MPTGVYERKRVRSKWTTITCAHCGASREYLHSFLKIHPIRFCSKKCAGLAVRKPETNRIVSCASCGASFTKRARFVKTNNYCSRACSDIGRRKKSIWSDHSPDREARRVYFRQYTSENRAKINALSVKWARNNRPYRTYIHMVRRAAGSLTRVQLGQLWASSGGKCAHCGATDNLQVDHKLAVAKGGKTDLQNLQILCKPCNVSKGTGDFPLLPGIASTSFVHGIEVEEF